MSHVEHVQERVESLQWVRNSIGFRLVQQKWNHESHTSHAMQSLLTIKLCVQLPQEDMIENQGFTTTC